MQLLCASAVRVAREAEGEHRHQMQPCPCSRREMGFKQDRRDAPQCSPYQASQATALLCKQSWPCLSQTSVTCRCPCSNRFILCAMSKISVSLSHYPGRVSAGTVMLVARAGGHVSALLGSSCCIFFGGSQSTKPNPAAHHFLSAGSWPPALHEL